MQDDGVTAHYNRAGSLAERILQLARTHGPVQEATLRAPDLERFDQFHMSGSRSTARLAELAEPEAGDLVLDVSIHDGSELLRFVLEQEAVDRAPAPRLQDLPVLGCRVLDAPLHEVVPQGLGAQAAARPFRRALAWPIWWPARPKSSTPLTMWTAPTAALLSAT